MYGLLFKELLLNKKSILSILAAVALISSLIFIPAEGAEDMKPFMIIMSLLMSFLVIGMLEQGIFEKDEIKKWQCFIVSSPNGIKNQMTAKYLFILLISSTAAFLFILLINVCFVVYPDINFPLDLIYGIVCVQLALRSIEIPFIVRFGSKVGNSIRIFIVFLLAAVIFVYMLFGDLSVFGSPESFILWVNNLLFTSNGMSQLSQCVLLLSPAATLVMYYLSYKISCSLYLKGGDYYDK